MLLLQKGGYIEFFHMDKRKKTAYNKVHIAGRGSVVRQLRILASQFRVLRTGTRSEIRPDNMYQPLPHILKKDTD
jgi:hypothetical protein